MWIRKSVNIWCDHHLHHAAQHISFTYSWSVYWLWPVECCPTPLQWLCVVVEYWRELEHAVIHIDPELPKHAQWVTCLVIRPLEWYWRWLMVEKWTFNSLATVLVDISAVCMPIARSLKTWDICGIMLCDKNAHYRVAFYCPQHKVHLCNDHAV